MARKSEVGIEYFPMNTDIINSPKIKLVVAEFGPKAWAVLLPLYCKIYREKGYWIDWNDDDLKLLFAQDECKMEISTVNEIVSGYIRRSLFDKRVFEMFGILTSDRIQENYLIAKKRNLAVDFISEFNAIPGDVHNYYKNVNIIDLDVNIITKKVNIGTQKKKEKKIIEEEGDCASAKKLNPEEILLFKQFQEWISKNAPRVNQLKQPFTIDQYLKIRKVLSKEMLTYLLIKMHNWKPLLTKNVSAYLTILDWSGRQEEKSIPGESHNETNERLKQLANAKKERLQQAN